MKMDVLILLFYTHHSMIQVQYVIIFDSQVHLDFFNFFRITIFLHAWGALAPMCINVFSHYPRNMGSPSESPTFQPVSSLSFQPKGP